MIKMNKQFYWKKTIGDLTITIFILGNKYSIEIDMSSKKWR